MKSKNTGVTVRENDTSEEGSYGEEVNMEVAHMTPGRRKKTDYEQEQKARNYQDLT